MGLMHFSFLPESLGFHTNVYIILPYDSSMEMKPFPVLYLLHGGAGNALDWIRNTSIERYAEENGIAVVMPEVGGSSFYGDMVHGYKYYTYMTEELPMVLNCYFPISNKREERFVAGLSMGGYGAFKWAFDKPEYFSAAANFSGFSLMDEIFNENTSPFAKMERTDEKGICNLVWGGFENMLGTKNDTRYMVTHAIESKADLPRLYASIGTEDFSYQYAKRYIEFMRSNGLEVKYEEMEGTHQWKVWDVAIKHFIEWALGKENI
jgi:putative tributyrin esterase